MLPDDRWAIYQAVITKNAKGSLEEEKRIIGHSNLGYLRWQVHGSFAEFLRRTGRIDSAAQMQEIADGLDVQNNLRFAFEAPHIYLIYSY